MFSLVDVIILAIVVAFTVVGFSLGFVSSLGTLVGAIGGIFVASHIAPQISAAFGGSQIATVVLFVILYLIVSRLIGLLFWFVDRTFKILSIIPFVKPINHLLGGVLGFLEGLLLMAATAYFAKQILPMAMVVQVIDSSKVATSLIGLFDHLKLLLPANLQKQIPTP